MSKAIRFNTLGKEKDTHAHCSKSPICHADAECEIKVRLKKAPRATIPRSKRLFNVVNMRSEDTKLFTKGVINTKMM